MSEATMTQATGPRPGSNMLGLPSAEELGVIRNEARDAVADLVFLDACERSDAVTRTLGGYLTASHAEVRAEMLKDAMDAFGGTGEELITNADWARIHKSFKATLAESKKKKSKAAGRERYQDAIKSESLYSESVYTETVCDERLEGEFVHTDGFGWMQYNGRFWKAVSEDIVFDVVRVHAAETAIQAHQDRAADPRELQKMMKTQFVTNVLKAARGRIKVADIEFDAQPDLFNCMNGTINLRTGELRPHDAADRLTKCAPTEYIPGARDPAWDQSLSSMEPEVAAWMQLRYGNGITGHVADDHRMCFLNGTGGNGKSMHLDGISHTIGSGRTGYLAMLSDGALVAQNPDKEAIMSFRGARLAIMEELPAGRQLNVASLKRLVGTREMTGRHLYKSEMTWAASHSLFVTSNYELSVNETDDGTWRRLVKCPFPYSYKDAHDVSAPHERVKDYTLADRLAGSSARRACLAWLVAGAVRWYKEGLGRTPLPAQVQAATDGWRNEADMVFRFFHEHLIPAPGHHIAASDMLKAFNAVMADESQAAWSQKTFSSRAKDHTTFKRAAIGTGQVRGGQGAHPVASRRNSSAYGMDALPSRYMAFTGVRFRTDADDVDELIEADPIEASGVTREEPQAAEVSDPWSGGYLADGEYTYLDGSTYTPHPDPAEMDDATRLGTDW